jgi:hypothetical protein
MNFILLVLCIPRVVFLTDAELLYPGRKWTHKFRLESSSQQITQYFCSSLYPINFHRLVSCIVLYF